MPKHILLFYPEELASMKQGALLDVPGYSIGVYGAKAPSTPKVEVVKPRRISQSYPCPQCKRPCKGRTGIAMHLRKCKGKA